MQFQTTMLQKCYIGETAVQLYAINSACMRTYCCSFFHQKSDKRGDRDDGTFVVISIVHITKPILKVKDIIVSVTSSLSFSAA